jgi:hypothetical protein
MPICLSERQSLAVTRAAAALPLADRDPFLEAVAKALAGQEIGDGAVQQSSGRRVPSFLEATRDAAHAVTLAAGQAAFRARHQAAGDRTNPQR